MVPHNQKNNQEAGSEATLTIGLDIGYGVMKAVTDQPVMIFPSMCGYACDITFRPENLAKRYPDDQLSDDDGECINARSGSVEGGVSESS